MPKVGRTNGPDPQRSQLGYLFPASVTAGAPFGNDNTERFRVKLIAGKPELIPEDNKFTPREAPPTAVREKKSVRGREFNVHNITTYPQSLYIKNNSHESNEPQKGDSYTGDRSSREPISPYKVVPPINPAETVEKRLLSKLQRACDGQNLPRHSIRYSKEEELELKRLIQGHFRDLTLEKCKAIYVEATKYDGYDREPTGYVSFSDMEFALLKHDVHLNKEILRLVAAQFLGENTEYQKVNYEKILAYIRGAIIETDSGRLKQPSSVYETATSQINDGVYRNPITSEMEDYGPKSKKFPYGERENAKLRQTVNAQLIDAEELGMLDFEKTWQIFKEADRAHRGMMSRDQIYDLTFRCKIPLQKNLIDQIIDRACHASNGQYDWQHYLDFIEKVCPVNTGLQLSKSKRPAEYVKHMPEPSVNWPHGNNTNSNEHYSPLPDKYHSPRKATTDYTNPYDDYGRRSPGWNKATDYSKNYGDPYDRSQSKQSQIESINGDIKRLEQKFAQDRSQLLTQRERAAKDTDLASGEPWFNRYLKMTDALYKSDKNYTGVLPYQEAKWIINRYNDAFYLGISDQKIENALQRSKENDSLIMIDNLADILSKEDRS